MKMISYTSFLDVKTKVSKKLTLDTLFKSSSKTKGSRFTSKEVSNGVKTTFVLLFVLSLKGPGPRRPFFQTLNYYEYL